MTNSNLLYNWTVRPPTLLTNLPASLPTFTYNASVPDLNTVLSFGPRGNPNSPFNPNVGYFADVLVTVTDDNFCTHTHSETIFVRPRPSAELTSASSFTSCNNSNNILVAIESPVSQSINDTGINYTVDWGDGTLFETGTYQQGTPDTLSHNYSGLRISSNCQYS